MKSKHASYICLFLLILMGIFYFIGADNFRGSKAVTTLGPDYYPKILAIMLIGFCLINLFQTRKQNNDKITINNVKLVFFAIIIVALYILSWSLLGLFYLNTFIFLLCLLYLFQSKQKAGFNHFLNIAISLGLVFFIFILFDWVMLIEL